MVVEKSGHVSLNPVRKVHCAKCGYIFETTSRVRKKCGSCAPARAPSNKLLESL